jgi:hypothetical protein
LKQGWPVSGSLLKNMHKDLKSIALKNYKRATVGEAAEEFKEELTTKIIDKYNLLKMENKREFERILVNGMLANYKPIDKKIANSEYKNFFDFEKDLRGFQQRFIESEPHGPNKELLILDFVFKKFQEATYGFIKTQHKANQEQVSVMQAAREALDKELLNLKDEKLKQKNDLMSKLSDLDGIKGELEVKLQCVTQNLTEVKHENELLEQNMKLELSKEKEETKTTLGDMRQKLQESEDKMNEMERSLMIKMAEFDKERSLSDQKISFLEQQIENYSKNELSKNSEFQYNRDELMGNWQQASLKYEAQLGEKDKEISTMNERLNELEEEMTVKDNRFDDLDEAMLKKEKKWKEEVMQLEEKLNESIREYEELKTTGGNMLTEVPIKKGYKTCNKIEYFNQPDFVISFLRVITIKFIYGNRININANYSCYLK